MDIELGVPECECMIELEDVENGEGKVEVET